MHARVQIPVKSVPCDCLLPFLALTSITDLTQWLRLQEICTPWVQIPDKSSVALYFAFLCTPQVQIPEKSLVPCNCLTISCLTSITDLTQWLRLQEICTPQVQIHKSSLALCLAFLFMPWVQIPGKSLVANSFLPIFCNMGAITDQYCLATSLFFAPPIQLGFIAKRVSQ